MIFKRLVLFPSKIVLKLIYFYGNFLNFLNFKKNKVFKRDLIANIYSLVGDKIKNQIQKVIHINIFDLPIHLSFYIPNRICKMRVDTFSSKEPEILRWIDNCNGGVFWDIGANIGLYSIYYSKCNKGKVVSFEPSFFNLTELSRNISLNELSEKIDIFPLPLTSNTAIADFKLSSLDSGAAANAYGVNYGGDGFDLKEIISYKVLGFSADDLLDKGLIKDIPNSIKIDVDGIEHLILKGMEKIIKSEDCLSIFIEVNDAFYEQQENVSILLKKAGFTLSEKTHSLIAIKGSAATTYNQIWNKIKS